MLFKLILILLSTQVNADDIRPSTAPLICPFKPQQIVRPTTTVKLREANKIKQIEVDSNNVFIVSNKRAPQYHCSVVHDGKIYFVNFDNLQIWNPVVNLKQYADAFNKKCEDCGFTEAEVKEIQSKCVLDKIKSGAIKWNAQTAGDVVKNCEMPEMLVIPRENDSRYCRGKEQDLSMAKSWKACPPPADCTEEQENEHDKISSLVLELDKARCKAPVNQKKIDALRSEIKKLTHPKCLEKFKMKPNKIAIHHSALSPLIGPDGLQKSHVEGRGFYDLGYHYVISQTASGEWKVFEGRNIKYKGAHIGAGLNSDSIGIVIAGNYAGKKPSALNPAGDLPLPPPEAVALLTSLVGQLKTAYPIEKIYSHRALKEMGSGCSTECPSEGCIHITNKINERYFLK